MEIQELLGKKWKDKYSVGWCETCDVARIICPECKNISCSGAGCNSCIKDDNDWKKVKNSVKDYLSEEEKRIYEKCLYLKDMILECIRENEDEINWKRLYEDGKMSKHQAELFKDYIPADVNPYDLK